jgi:hypothetical protein
VDQISYGEARPFQDELIRCQSDHDDYACPHGRVAMSGGDGTLECPSSNVSGLLWLRPVVPGIKLHRFPRTRPHWRSAGTGEPLGVAAEGRGVCRAGA